MGLDESTMEAVSGMKSEANTVLCIAAHPDDEILGCGGTLARHAANGDSVHLVILAEGARARDTEGDDEVAALRRAAKNAARELGVHAPRLLGLPDNRLDSLDLLDVIKPIEAVVREVKPSTVYTHHGGDLNVDHRIAHEATITACRPMPGSPVKRIYSYETVSSTEWATAAIGEAFMPNRFVDVSGFIDAKRRAIKCYQLEMRPFPHPRSVEAVDSLAKLRGSQAGIMAAEAFLTLLEIET